MVKKLGKIFIAVVSSVVFGMLNYSALNYGNLITEKNHFPMTNSYDARWIRPAQQQPPVVTPTGSERKPQKPIANHQNAVLNSPALTTTNCAN